MKLSVLNIAYPLAPVGLDAVGGSEQVITQLDRSLSRYGHHSMVIACEGSTVYGELFSIPTPKGVFNSEARADVYQVCACKIKEVLDNNQVDVVHMHSVDFYQYLPSEGTPILVTLHLPLSWYPKELFQRKIPRLYMNCV